LKTSLLRLASIITRFYSETVTEVQGKEVMFIED